jgi:RHS repeat-associated protein
MKISKTAFFRAALVGFFLLTVTSTGLAQLVTNTSGGRFLRGSGTNESYMSVVIPLSFQVGVGLPLMNYQIVGTDYFPWNATNGVLYHYNGTNTASQSGTSGRIPFNEPIVAFGARAGGSPLYTGQPYKFGFAAGQPVSYTQSLAIMVYRKSDFSLADSYFISIPDPVSNTNEWAVFVTNGYSKTVTAGGLTTTLQFDSPYRDWGINFPAYHLTHVANTNAYIYQVIFAGLTDKGDVVLNTVPQAAYSYLYTVEFQTRSPWRSTFVDQPQFAGQPMPPGYDGKTTDELLTNPPPVTNIVSLPLSPATYTNIDQSPELRRHPLLDQFVSDMRNDPIALTAYVQNRIKLVDAMALNDSGSTSDPSVNLGGVNRSALTTFLSGEGSPAEQCSLLIYLLRQAGYPAVYEYAPTDKLLMLDTRLSKMLRMQVQGAVNSLNGSIYTSNRLIAVNYPWVATYVSNQWVHVFPWIKDTEIVEGLNLWDLMPTNYNNAYKWVLDYVKGNTNLLGLASENSPGALFPAYLKQMLLQNHPGISVDDVGVQITDRQNSYLRWSDFPRPSYVTNFSYSVESFSDPAITNVSRNLTNIFDLVSVKVFSQSNTNKQIATGNLRMMDVLNRKFLLRFEKITTNSHRMILSLEPYRTNVTGIGAFTNDLTLLKQESITNSTLTNTDDVITIQTTYLRHRALTSTNAFGFFEAYETTNSYVSSPQIRKGDLTALCFSIGTVSKKMLQPHAQEYWNMEQQLQSNPSLTNSISPDIYQGTAAYLMGMAYYEKVSQFNDFNEQLQKATRLSTYNFGLSKLSAKRVNGVITNGTIDLIEPQVDMTFQDTVYVGNRTLHPDSGEDPNADEGNLTLLNLANLSAQEHQIINSFFQQADAISTVKLLQLAQSRATNGAPGIQILTRQNYLSLGNSNFFGVLLKNADTNQWKSITNEFATDIGSNYMQYIVTPGTVTNNTGSYKGMGVLQIDIPSAYGAFISPNMRNGGAGENVPPGTFSPINMPYLQVNQDSDGNYILSYSAPSSSTSVASDTPPTFQLLSTANNANAGSYSITDFQYLNGNMSGLISENTPTSFGDGLMIQDQVGIQGQPSDHQTIGQYLADPVDAVTGEFYVDATDLVLPGPMPLTVRRNYSSQNVIANQFGIGWKLSYMPFLTVNSDASVIYASEADGSVIAYQSVSNNVWMPGTTYNPQLNTHTTLGTGSTANLFNGKIVKSVNGPNTFYTLSSPNGSVRLFQVMTFTGLVTSTRPYLIKWTDNRGNYYTCQYGADSTQADFGQARRIQCSNGNYLGFYFDVYGHITEAYTGDGRRLYYDYDNFGDLVTVTLPDESQISYVYQHKNQSVTNGSVVAQIPYSTHLIVQELKPDGRELDNAYDGQRRVTNQLATVGQDLNLVRSASFVYNNNFVLTNSFTNTITGSTIVTDVNGNPSRYDYSGSMITNITDQLGQTIQQVWYTDNATAPGYPRSLWKVRDKRGLWTIFQYDSAGNVTNRTVIGDLAGTGNTNDQAVTTTIYNTNNLPLQITDPATNIMQFVYDPTYNFLPQQIIRISSGTAVSTDFMFYGNVTNIFANGTLTVTNTAFGLMQRQVRAYGSPDAATNDVIYDGRGTVLQQIKYTGTTDPNIIINSVYDNRNELVQQTDATNRSVLFYYDPLGRPTGKEFYNENASIVEWSYNYYNDNGELVWTDGPHFNPEDYTWRDYDGAGRKIQEIHWRSRGKADGSGVEAETGDNLYATTFYSYDSAGNLTNAIDPRQNYSAMRYDALGRMTQNRSYNTNNVLLKTEGYSYEPGGQIATATNVLGGVTTVFYTDTGKPEMRVNPDGTTNQWRYYLDGRMAQEIQPNGAYWQYTYDDVNRIVTRNYLNAGFGLSPREIKQFDRRGNLIGLTDVDNNVFTNTYDDLDRPKTASGAVTTGGSDQQTTTYVYDNSGKVLTVVDGLGEKNITTSDVVGRPVSVEIRDGSNNRVRWMTNSYTLDHNSVTVTQGTTNVIVTTTFTDTYGKPVITQRFLAGGITEETVNSYDTVGNLLTNKEISIQGGNATTYALTVSAFDGLNRPTTQTRNGSEIITFTYDPAGNVTNRAMPGPLAWSSRFDSANRITHEELRGSDSNPNRVFNYSYYTSGTNIGLLQTLNDPRSITFTYAYNGFRRLASKTSSGSAQEQNMTTLYQYDNRGNNIDLKETTGGQPGTEIVRTYDGYSQLTDEQIFIGGLLNREVSQNWDAAGRRKEMIGAPAFKQGAGSGRDITYGYRADGLMNSLNPGGIGYSFNYGDNGLLTSRSNPFRTETISSRDGMGRILSVNQTVSSSQLQETLTWRPDGKLTNYSGVEPGFTDARAYTYNYSQMNRLTNETLALLPGQTPSTFTYTYDFGASGGPGIRSENTLLGNYYLNDWVIGNTSTFLDPLHRIITEEENYIARRASEGTASDVAYLTSTLDGRVSKNVDYDPISDKWRTVLQLNYIDGYSYSTHIVRGYHPSGVVTAAQTNQYADSALDFWTNNYDAFGNYTVHKLRTYSGAAVNTETLTWDAAGRMIKVANRDDASDGFDWTATYDGLGRRLRTIYTPIIGGVSRTNVTLTLDSWYDPQVKYLEVGVAVNGQRTWKIYGPDISQGSAMQGLGGLESTIREYDGKSIGIINDYFGNGVAMITNGVTTFGGRVTSYGPIPLQDLPLLSPYTSVAESTIWRGKRIDPSGFYYMGARYYDPNAGRFISPDPLGHAASIDLYAAFGGDAVNYFDPDGRCIETTGAVVVDTATSILADIFTPRPDVPPELLSPQEQQAYANISQNVQDTIGHPLQDAGAYDPNSGAALTRDAIKTGIEIYALATAGQQMVNVPITVPEPNYSSPQTGFYVTPDGTVVPATGYRAIGGSAVAEAQTGTITPNDGPTYFTFDNIIQTPGVQVNNDLQLFGPTRTHVAMFDTLQLIGDLRIPTEFGNTGTTPEPITASYYPTMGTGGRTQAITASPIQGVTVLPLQQYNPAVVSWPQYNMVPYSLSGPRQ